MNWNGSDVDPRLNNPSFHNPYFANLPLATLHAYRRLARSSHVADTALPVRQHLNSIMKPNWKPVAQRPKGGTGYTYG